MLTLAAKALRAQGGAWVGSLLMVVATGAVIAVVASQFETALSIPGDAGDIVRQYSLPMGVLSVAVAAIVLPTVLSRTISIQTRDYALLRLAGALAGQVRSLLSLQVALLALLAAPFALLLGYPLSLFFFDQVVAQSSDLQGTALVFGPGTIIGTAAMMLGFTLGAGLRAARQASEVPALDVVAERASARGRAPARSVLRWIGRAIGLAVSLVLLVGLFQTSGGTVSSTILNVLGLSALFSLTLTILVASSASLWLPVVTQLWTSLVPSRAPTWFLARRSVEMQVKQTSAGVVPLYAALALTSCIFSLLWTADNAFVAAGRIEAGDTATNMVGVLVIICGALFLSAVGAAVAVIVANRDRRREYALRLSLGDGNSAIVLSAILEATIHVVSSLLLAGVVTVVSVIVGTLAFARHVGPIPPSIEIAIPTVVAGAGLVLLTLSLLPPALQAAREKNLIRAMASD